MKTIEILSPPVSEMFRSPDPKSIFCYSPGICALRSGRLIGSLDLMGKGTAKLEGAAMLMGKSPCLGKVFLSDDGGMHWRFAVNFPFIFARPFEAGGALYLLGCNGDLVMMRSNDEGETWSDPVRLTEGMHWHQAPSNVCYANGNIYLVMERVMYEDCRGWEVSTLAPVLMRAKLTDDLTNPESWDYATPVAFCDLVDRNRLYGVAIPFYETRDKEPVQVCGGAHPRCCAPIGWLETNVVHFEDPSHIWCDESGHTFHLWMRAHTGGTGYAAVLRVVERPDGSMETMPVQAPSGRDVFFVPCPGGQMKFHILYDDVTKLFWLLGTQATDSMIRPEWMPENRFDLPNNERQRLVLHFSRNCIDWCFAGLVDQVKAPNMSRHYASMAIHGEDLVILSRSGDEQAATAHNGNCITCHRIERFRELVY